MVQAILETLGSCHVPDVMNDGLYAPVELMIMLVIPELAQAPHKRPHNIVPKIVILDDEQSHLIRS